MIMCQGLRITKNRFIISNEISYVILFLRNSALEPRLWYMAVMYLFV